MYLACHGCCGQRNAGFRTCTRAGACRKCCCLVRQVSKDAYPGTWQLSSTSAFLAGAVNSKEGKGVRPKSVGTDLLWAFQKLHWKELKGGKWRVEREVPDFKVPFSEFSSKCWRLKFVFVSVLCPLPISFFLWEDGGRPFREAHGGRRSSSRQQFIQGKIRLGMIRHCFTMSTVKQHWIGLSREAGKSLSWESAASKFLFPLDCAKLYFCYFFFLLFYRIKWAAVLAFLFHIT